MKVKFIIIALLIGCYSNSIAQKFPSHADARNDLKKFYDEYNVEGTFILFNSKTKKYITCNQSLLNQPSTPASTFNVLNVLIGLQEGHLTENSIFNWTNGNDTFPSHRAFRLDSAFMKNVEWCFWILSDRIGAKRMKQYLDKIRYGNVDISGEAEKFWSGSTLKITPLQQLDFIRKLYYEKLPFSKQYFSLVKKWMLEKVGPGYKIVGKRGSYKVGRRYLGWFVGYVEMRDNVFFFTNYIQSSNLNHPTLVNAQKDIVYKILKELRITN